MTNNVIGFDIGGIKGVVDTNTKIKRLFFSSTSTAAASYHTLIDWTTGAAYQVPTAKKTTIFYINNYAPIATASGQIIYADNADGNTNAVTLFQTDPDTTTRTNFVAILTAAPASKYINFRRTNAAGTKELDVYAIEEAA